MSNISFGKSNGQIQVQGYSRKKTLGNFVRRFLDSIKRGIIK